MTNSLRPFVEGYRKQNLAVTLLNQVRLLLSRCVLCGSKGRGYPFNIFLCFGFPGFRTSGPEVVRALKWAPSRAATTKLTSTQLIDFRL